MCRVGIWTCDLGQAKPVRYPLGGGTLQFKVRVRLLLRVLYIQELNTLIGDAINDVAQIGSTSSHMDYSGHGQLMWDVLHMVP